VVQPAVATAAGYAADPAVVRESVKAAAVAIEVFHKASLVHDDIEDDDAMRYGQSTLHRARGVPTAINVGDHLLGLGYRIVSGLVGVDAGTSRDVVRLLADAHVRLARGQGAELWWRDDGDRRLAPAEALAIYGLKTSPAFEAAIAIGIRLAGLEPGVAAAVDRYALHVGTGFQVLNDLKDWQGDLENARRAAGDLLGGRPTVMWALAMERLSGDEAARLRKLAGMAAAADAPEAAVAAAVAEARELYRRADVFVRTAAIVRDERAGAAAAIAGCRLPRLREVLEFLLDLAVPESAADVGAG
jgi:geranylgeranyl pyrophosphate synthase